MNKNKETKKLLIYALLYCLLFGGSVQAATTDEMQKTNKPTTQCKPTKPSNKYHANLSVESITACDESGCQTESAGSLSSINTQQPYYLRLVKRGANEYTYYLLDRKTFKEYQVKITPAACGQVNLSLPISLNPGVADTDTVEMKCLGTVNKKNGAISGNCEGSFFSFQFNSELTFSGPFDLAPTKQVVINPCNTPEGILIYGTQCSGR